MTENENGPRVLKTPKGRRALADGEAAAMVAQEPPRCHATRDTARLACGSYGLTPQELRAEARRLIFEKGWQLWEVTARLGGRP
jgi:hypothetical protein